MRWLFRALGAVFLLGLIGLGLLFMIPADRIAAAAAAQFEQLTGRKLVIEGDIETAMDAALAKWGHPTTIVSTPLEALHLALALNQALPAGRRADRRRDIRAEDRD